MRNETGSVAIAGTPATLADIGHVHLRVADLERTIDFYTKTLGMRVVLRQPKHAFLAFGDYHHHLALDSRGDVGPHAGDANARAGLHHFAIRFPDQASLAAAIARVRDAGGELKGADFTVSRSAFAADPDGNTVELTCDQPRAGWPANWASVEGLGRWRPLDPAEIGTATGPAPSRYVAARPGDGAAYWTVGMRMVVLVPSSATEGRFTLCEFNCPPGFATPLHVHSREDETFCVVGGEIRYLCGETRRSAGPGTAVHLPRGLPHAFATGGTDPLRLLHVASPSGLERFHIAVGVPASGPPPNPSALDRDAIARAAADCGVTTLGPPPRALFEPM